MKKLLFLIPILTAIACQKGQDETLQTAYIDPLTLPRVYTYSFSRNGSSNVDVLEATLLKESVSYLYAQLKRANLFYADEIARVKAYYTQGLYNISPQSLVATSPLHKGNRPTIDAYLLSLIETSARISGYVPSQSLPTPRQMATTGQYGYIGSNLGDFNLAFADEKGIVISEVFDNALLGALYLDKVLNYHLDSHFLDDAALRTDHENTLLVVGHNYTALEHHWDLAYGYYTTFLKALTQLHGIPLIKDSEQTLFQAFVQGRIELARYRYEAMYEQLYIIRQELSKVVAACAMNYLVGVNTLSNLKNIPQDAFGFLSKGYGLTYALQFTRKPNGEPYFTASEVETLLKNLTQGNGLWDTSRLLSDENTSGSLLQIADAIGKPFGVSHQDLQR